MSLLGFANSAYSATHSYILGTQQHCLPATRRWIQMLWNVLLLNGADGYIGTRKRVQMEEDRGWVGPISRGAEVLGWGLLIWGGVGMGETPCSSDASPMTTSS